jgi:hypothetical protein
MKRNLWAWVLKYGGAGPYTNADTVQAIAHPNPTTLAPENWMIDTVGAARPRIANSTM